MKKNFSAYGIDWFLPALLVVILLAYFFPQAGIASGTFSLTELSGYGITLIFFFYGLRQDPKQFAAGLSNWKMHLLIQSTTFVLFPLLALLLRPFFHGCGDGFDRWRKYSCSDIQCESVGNHRCIHYADLDEYDSSQHRYRNGHQRNTIQANDSDFIASSSRHAFALAIMARIREI